MAISIDVSEVIPTDELLPQQDFRSGVERTLGAAVEACGGSADRLIRGTKDHPFLAAAFRAFQSHYPLTLRPDDIWLLLTQGLALHVRANSEELRPRFVPHDGRVDIQVRRDDFVPGDPSNPWPEVFSAFSAEIERIIGPKRDLIVADFSTTGPAERAASEIVLMDTLQGYVRYSLMTLCGIPRVYLEGTLEDWRSVRARARNLGEFGLEDWARALDPVLGKIVESLDGGADRAFWQSFYSWESMSGGAQITGWVNVLFPYLEQAPGVFTPNPHASRWKGNGGPTANRFPLGMSKAPFEWLVMQEQHSMEFLGGFVGVSQDPETLALRPEIGWAVRPATLARVGASQRDGEAVTVSFLGPSPAVEQALECVRSHHGVEWIDPEDRRAGFELSSDDPPLRVLGRAGDVPPTGVVLVLAPGSDQDWATVGEACEQVERSLIKAGRIHSTPVHGLCAESPEANEDAERELEGVPPGFFEFIRGTPVFHLLERAPAVLEEIKSEVLGEG